MRFITATINTESDPPFADIFVAEGEEAEVARKACDNHLELVWGKEDPPKVIEAKQENTGCWLFITDQDGFLVYVSMEPAQ